MPRCAETTCRRWRPDPAALEWLRWAPARRLGARQFNGRSYCSRACVEQAARADLDGHTTQRAAGTPTLPPSKLGLLLRYAGAITQAQLDAALVEHRKTGLRIGEQLERLGHATAADVLQALAVQAGVGYLTAFDVSRVAHGPAPLPAAMVRALGLVPFETDRDRRRLSVVTAAPLPRAAIRALATLTGYVPEVYLVADRVFQAAMDVYDAAHTDPAHDTATVDGLSAAAAHVADVVETQGAATMRLADCRDYMWVRVEGPRRVDDLIVAGA